MVNYYLAGYYLIKLNSTSERATENGFIYSANDCINTNILGSCGLSRTEQKAYQQNEVLKKLDISTEQLAEAREWAATAFEAGTIAWSNVFNAVDSAREYYRSFFAHQDNVVLLALSFNEKEASELTDLFATWENIGTIGVAQNLSKKILSTGIDATTYLGFDIVGVELGGELLSPFCCNKITQFIHKAQSPLNQYGLWDTDDAFYNMLNDLIKQENNPEAVGWFVCRVDQIKLDN